MSEVRIADELRLAAPIDVVWRAIEDDSTGFGRMVTGWRSGFSLAEREGATIVTAESTFRPGNLLVRAMLPVIRRKFHQTQQAILRGLQDAVEGPLAVPSSDLS